MGKQVRIIDRIDTAPRYSESDAVRLNNMFRGRDTVEMLTVLLKENMLGDAAIVSSFGAESSVLLHLIASIDPTIPVLFLETGKHFPETITYREELRERLGLTDLRNLTPNPALLAKKDGTGLRWSYDPDGCCEIRKVLPLKAALAGFDAQFSGRKAFQSSTRAALPRFEIEEGRLKVNPLADWDKARIESYLMPPSMTSPHMRWLSRAILPSAARPALRKWHPAKTLVRAVGRVGTRSNVAFTPKSRHWMTTGRMTQFSKA